jgi:hypothetical protein
MNKAAVILVPAALFAAAIWAITLGIRPMVAQENSNKFHAMILDCTYKGKMEKMEDVLIFDCNDRIELHKEVKLTNLTY